MAGTFEAATHSEKGTLRAEALFLSSEISRFLVVRQANEPEPEVALMGVPIPVGKYAAYIFETGTLYEQKYGEQVRRVVTRLKNEGLEDKQLDILAGPHINPHSENVNEIANRLGELASKLPK